MKIEFTRHAKFRCMTRRIPQEWVMELLQKIPLSTGNHKRHIEGTNLIIAYEDGETIRTVITVHLNRRSRQ